MYHPPIKNKVGLDFQALGSFSYARRASFPGVDVDPGFFF